MLAFESKELLLVEGLADLKNRLAHMSDYSLIKASGLIRQMLIDGGNSTAPPLAKKYGVKLEFLVNIHKDANSEDANFVIIPAVFKLPGANIGSMKMTLGDAQSISYKSIIPTESSQFRGVSIEQFLQQVCIQIGDREINVREIVLTVANVKGGVHSGEPKAKNPEQGELQDIDAYLRLGDKQVTLWVMRDIAAVVIQALEPIVSEIMKNSKVDPAEIRRLEALLSSDPGSEYLLRKLGELTYASGDYSKSLEYFKRIKIDNENPNAGNIYALGRLHAIVSKDFALAADLIKKALEIEPNNAKYNSLMAGIMDYMGDLEGAFHYNEKALNINPNMPESLYLAGKLMDYRGDFEESLKCFKKLISIDSRHAYGYLAIAHLFKSKFMKDETANKYYITACNLDANIKNNDADKFFGVN